MQGIWKNFAVIACTLMLGGMSGCATQSSGIIPENDGVMASLSNTMENYSDIEMPIQMELVPEETMGLDTDSFQGGVYRYEGQVELNSLIEYVTTSMRNHKWKMVGEARYDYKRMLAYTKPNRTCLIVLLPGDSLFGKTTATFYITVDVSAAGRVNPFGESIQ